MRLSAKEDCAVQNEKGKGTWKLLLRKIDTETMKSETEREKGSDQSSGTKCRSKVRILEGVVHVNSLKGVLH